MKKFGKILAGIAAGAAVVIAAPVALPALAATGVGAAVTGAAATVGAAVTGAAATAGAAVAGVGSAVAGTAVGGAVTTAMGAVGTAVGAGAAAISSAPVIGGAAATVASITGTAAGAAGVGTIATMGTAGAVSAASGAKKLSQAKEIKEEAVSKYEDERGNFESCQESTNKFLKKLGEEKLKIWESFDRFSVMYSKIQNPPTMSGDVSVESASLTVEELKNIKAVAISAKDLLSGGVGSVSAGSLVGLATSGGIASTITVASTGTAIVELSGAAATNATLAAFGGGSLAAGGAGMAGGAAVLGGLTVAPILMVGGLALNNKAKKSLEAAESADREADRAVRKMREAEGELKKIDSCSKKIRKELKALNKLYTGFISNMELVVEGKKNYLSFTMAEKKLLEKTILTLKLLKQVSMQNILDNEHDHAVLTDDVNAVVTNAAKVREEKLQAA